MGGLHSLGGLRHPSSMLAPGDGRRRRCMSGMRSPSSSNPATSACRTGPPVRRTTTRRYASADDRMRSSRSDSGNCRDLPRHAVSVTVVTRRPRDDRERVSALGLTCAGPARTALAVGVIDVELSGSSDEQQPHDLGGSGRSRARGDSCGSKQT